MTTSSPVLDDRIQSYLAETTIVRFATVTPSGRPHVAPFWFATDGERIVIGTLANQTTRNLAANPDCSLLVDLGTDFRDLRGAHIRGHARMWRDDEVVPEAVRTLLAEINRIHSDELRESEFERYERWETRVHVFIEMIPESATWFDLGGAEMGRTGNGAQRPIGPASR
ncbi:MAG TPA: pyridoxamine 5'-phosphate oxidase family protein [Candidatus Limnocylindrales bacterium]|nr:pyridoxamine 5'-phosphate oxidase family protein [Candidatus Limnocylindrales bacterium]